jgi:type IV pilus assembly protein PilP
MKQRRLVYFASYLIVGLLATLLAFGVSLKMIGRTQAQESNEAAPSAPVNAGAPGSQQTAPPSRDATTNGQENVPNAEEPSSEAAAPSAPVEDDSVSMMREFLEPFIYDANNRRDPFQPYINVSAPAVPEVTTGKYDTDDFQLVGIMWDIRDPKAMFLDPDRKVHIMSRDESIGRHNGYIAAIREGEVVVVESQRTQNDIIYKTKVIKISR